MKDKNGKKIDYYFEAFTKKNDLKIESSIVEKNDIRYLKVFNKLSKKTKINYIFYDKSKKIKIDISLIKTYVDMWNSLLKKEMY